MSLSAVPDDLLAYYKRELDYVRNAGRDFARLHPQVAARLELGQLESQDPHVERLIESFAFLSGRIRRDLDNAFPEISGALLDALYPHLTAPVPPMTVVRFALDPAQSQASAGRTIERGTQLHAAGLRARDGAEVPCQFRTCSALTLWPVTVTAATFEDPAAHRATAAAGKGALGAVLRLRLTCTGGTRFGHGEGQIRPDSLRFHLYGDWAQVNPLYELLLCHVRGAALVREHAPLDAQALARGVEWREAGYTPEEAALPVPGNAHPAYRLLQEYFACPRKFMFFEAAGLGPRFAACVPEAGAQSVDLLLALDRTPPAWLVPEPSNFLLGCTPAVNLFERTCDPLRADHRLLEHRVCPDGAREASTEIHSILSVSAGSADGQKGVPLTPYLAFGQPRAEQGAARYVVRRAQSLAPHGGTDVFMSFVGLQQADGLPAVPLVSVRTLCSNRALAESMRPDPHGADAELHGPCAMSAVSTAGILPVACLYQPSRQAPPPLGGERMWRLVSLLTLNHLSLENGETARTALQQLLDLCNAGGGAGARRQLAALTGIACETVARPVRGGPAPGFRRGIEVTLEFADGGHSEGSPLMLAAVLRHFFPLYVSVNAFASVTVKRGQEVLKAWPAI